MLQNVDFLIIPPVIVIMMVANICFIRCGMARAVKRRAAVFKDVKGKQDFTEQTEISCDIFDAPSTNAW